MKSPAQFGVSTWLWTSPFTSESVSLFPRIRAMGFDAVEIPVEYPDLIDPLVVRRALHEHQLQPVVCGAFGPSRDLTNEDTAVQQHCLDYIARCMELCNSWGATFFAGPMYAAVGKARLVPARQRDTEWKRAVDNLRKVCERAASHDLLIALEPLNRFESDLVNTAADVKRLLADIDHPAARIMLDSFHMAIEERNAGDAIRTAGDQLIHVQVSENHRGVPGTGQTHWHTLRQALDEIHYSGVISIESFTPEIKELAAAVCIWKTFADNQDQFARQGLAFLRKTFEGEGGGYELRMTNDE